MAGHFGVVGEEPVISAEQRARDLLEQCGVEDAQSFTAGDVVALANFIAHANRRDRVWEGRIRHVRAMCMSSMEFDAGKAGGGLTDRAWLAEGVLAILDGAIDDQIVEESEAGRE